MTNTNKLTSNDIQPGPFSEHELRERWNKRADKFNQWDSLDRDEQLAWAQTQALSSKGCIVPSVVQSHVPPADGEVAELVEMLIQEGGVLDAHCNKIINGECRTLECLQRAGYVRGDVPPDSSVATCPELEKAGAKRRAAELLEQRYPAPVVVSERLPDPGVKVLAHYFNDLGEGHTICAIWVPAKSQSVDDPDLDDVIYFLEYDEVTDNYYLPEGWYEAVENSADLGYVKIYEGKIIYWQSLPKWPAHDQPRENQP